MKLFRLIRIASIPTGTFGVLKADDIPFCLTLERPWLNNKRNISCIPSGFYYCSRVDSPKFGNTFRVTDVPGRSHILFHKGNLMDDTHGCIILGEEFGYLNKQIAVLSSGRAFQEFTQLTKGIAGFYLRIYKGKQYTANLS